MEEKNQEMSSKMKLVLIISAALVTGVVFSWGEHKVHILSYAPYLIFLLCPILHLFMHGKHGKH